MKHVIIQLLDIIKKCVYHITHVFGGSNDSYK